MTGKPTPLHVAPADSDYGHRPSAQCRCCPRLDHRDLETGVLLFTHRDPPPVVVRRVPRGLRQ